MISPELTFNPMASLEQILAGADDLPVLPQIALRVAEIKDDSKASAAEIEKLIGMDQALAARVLALANSDYYGMPRGISTLREAVVFLGVKTIRNLAAAVTAFNVFLGHSDTPALARRALWRHSVDAAQCARAVTGLLSPAAQEAVGSDQAYVCGLLHDIGKLAIDRSHHALLVSISETARAHHVRFQEIETEVTPFGHAQIGSAIAVRWNLPPMICEAIAFHHTPRASELNPKLTATICVANEIAHFLEEASRDDDQSVCLLQACHDAVIPLRISEECLYAMVRACRSDLSTGLSVLAF